MLDRARRDEGPGEGIEGGGPDLGAGVGGGEIGVGVDHLLDGGWAEVVPGVEEGERLTTARDPDGAAVAAGLVGDDDLAPVG